jgi:hypothetical protein
MLPCEVRQPDKIFDSDLEPELRVLLYKARVHHCKERARDLQLCAIALQSKPYGAILNAGNEHGDVRACLGVLEFLGVYLGEAARAVGRTK